MDGKYTLMAKIACVYKITNQVDNKLYVGSTTDFNSRKRGHLSNLSRNKHHSLYLQNAYNKYGKENFIFEILEFCPNEQLIIREQFWHDLLQPEYCMMKNVKFHYGMKRSKETCQKISMANTGKRCSATTKEKLRLVNLGKKHSPETKRKISKALNANENFIKMIHSKERSLKIKQTIMNNGGYKISESTKIKISETLKAKHQSSATAIMVEQYNLSGILLHIYPTFSAAEKDNNLWAGSLSHRLNTLKNELYKGYIWKIKNQ